MLCFGKFPVAKRFMDEIGGIIKSFARNNFVAVCQKNLRISL